jgi:hypothetical protein
MLAPVQAGAFNLPADHPLQTLIRVSEKMDDLMIQIFFHGFLLSGNN